MAVRSSTSSSSWRGPALVLAGALGTLVGFEAWARTAYAAPTRLDAHTVAFTEGARDDQTNIVVFGTCLGERFLDAAALTSEGEPDWRVWNLSAAATGPIDWALVVRNRLDSRADVIVFLLTDGELAAHALAWESQVMDVASWSDLPDILTTTCGGGADCNVDYGARFLLHTVRYRERIGNRAWAALGAGKASRAPPPPGLGGTPGAKTAGLGVPSGPGTAGGAPPSTDGPAPAPPDRIAAAYADTQSSSFWLERAFADAREAGIPTAVLALPRLSGSYDRRALTTLERLARAGGATWTPPFTLASADYEDPAHPNADGARHAAPHLAAAIRTTLSAPR